MGTVNVLPVAQELGTLWSRVRRAVGNRYGLPPNPPLPTAPAMPPAVEHRALDFYRPYGGPEDIATIAGIVNAETQGMRDTPTENEPLKKAREKLLTYA